MISRWPALLAASLVSLAVLAPLAAVFWRAGGGGALGLSDWAAIRFTLMQAFLSALVSTVLAIPLARALARRDFIGRGVLITLLGAPFILPVLVAVLGLLAVFGRNGALNGGLVALGLPPVQVYGFQGVVLAHVFLNLPLASRMLLQGWQAIPSERFRLAAQLDLGPLAVARLLELPMLRATLPGAFLVIFAICLSSFAVALTLGGGPRATTVELAIYQAFVFDFDLGRAALLASVQLALVGIAALLARALIRDDGFGAGLDRLVRRWDAQGLWHRLFDAMIIMLGALFLLVPMVMVVTRGIAGLDDLPQSIYRTALNSITIALCSTLVSLLLALALAMGARERGGMISLLGLAVSPLVIGTGLFILVNPVINPAHLALVVTGLVNAVMALPFVYRILAPEVGRSLRDYGRTADMLGLAGLARLRWLILPRLRRPLGFAGGLAAALSMGDLGVIALFADPERATLPLQIMRLMGSYQMEAAAGAALLLLGLSLAIFWLFDKGGRLGAEA